MFFPPRVWMLSSQRSVITDKGKTFIRWFYPTSEKVLYLTIDDAPSRGTEKILAVLAQHSVPATFFTIGSYVAGREDVVAKIVEQGHQLGNHDLYDQLSAYCTNLSQLEQTETIIRKYQKVCLICKDTDAHVHFFRPGSGFLSQRLLSLTAKLNYTVVLGDVYAHDCQFPFPWFTAWHAKMRAQAGSIIILHDGDKALPFTAPRAENTARVLTEIIPYFQAQGYEFRLLK